MAKTNATFLVTGGGGYLGSVIVPMLLEYGHKVRVIDRFFWGKSILSSCGTSNNLLLIEADTRSLPENYFEGVDVVIDLAALSNDPVAELDPQKTLDINYHARLKTAMMAKDMGVKKYILASSCSVYGFNQHIADETSKVSPVTTYAKASFLAEKAVLTLSSDNFSVTVLRQGTLYGISPRMRFDLALNTMTLSLFKNNTITVEGGGQWRPIISVKDSADAFIKIAKTDSGKIHGQIFNVGAFEQNYQMGDLARLIVKTLRPDCKIIISKEKKDLRSYRVSFEKIKNIIGYTPKISPEIGAREIYQALKAKKIEDSMHTKTIDWYKHLLSKNPNILDVTLN